MPIMYKGGSFKSVKHELPPTKEEVEIAFWDGTCMCRTFGCYEMGEWWWWWWWCGGDRLEGSGIVATHWREPAALPYPPREDKDS